MGLPKRKNPIKNKKVESMAAVDYSEMKMPLIVIYNHPTDFPDKIIARVWESSINAATNVYAEYETLDECRKDIEKAGFLIRMQRSPQDEMHIVESYFR